MGVSTQVHIGGMALGCEARATRGAGPARVMLALVAGTAERGETVESDTEDERRAVERARGGDQDAFGVLVKAHAGRVWRVIWRIVRNDADAEDVTQEVFLTAWQSLGQYRGEARFGTWLHTIAVSRALNHLDRAAERIRRAATPLEIEDGDGPAGVRSEVEAAAPRGASPLEMMEAAELRRRLADCLERAPAIWRAILTLREAEGRSYDEIAHTLDIALGTVRSRLARARLSLKQCLEGSTT